MLKNEIFYKCNEDFPGAYLKRMSIHINNLKRFY